MIPVKPQEINIDTFLMITMVAAICRTRCPVRGDFGEESLLGNTFPHTKITPDLVQDLAGHKQPAGMVINRNRSHLMWN